MGPIICVTSGSNCILKIQDPWSLLAGCFILLSLPRFPSDLLKVKAVLFLWFWLSGCLWSFNSLTKVMVSSGKHFSSLSSQAENSTRAISRAWYRDVDPWGLNSVHHKSKCLWSQTAQPV